MKNRTTQVIYRYWNEVRQGRLAPKRFDIEPARIAGILAETLILEHAPDGIRFRLAGTRIAEQFGAELRGMNFLDMWSPDERHELRHKLETMRKQGGALVFEIEALTAGDRAVTFEAILLPLVHTHDEVDRFLGAISCASPPFWLGTEPLTSMHLLSSDIVWPDGRPHEVAQRYAQPPVLNVDATARIVRYDRRQFRVLDGGRKLGT